MAINDSGSNYKFYNHLEKARPPRSVFDKSFLHTTTISNSGKLVPVALFETLPGDTWTLGVKALVRAMAQVVPLMSRQRLFLHAYYSRSQELWNEFETFMTKGYDGKTVLSMPTISEANFDTDLWDSGNGIVRPGSMADYLGLPQGAKYSDLASAGVSALPFMMVKRVVRDYYTNFNYHTTDRYLLPNDDGDFRLNTSGTIISTDGATTNPIPFGTDEYRDWTQDFFTSALPWPQRGAQATMSANPVAESVFSGDSASDSFQRLIRQSDGANVGFAGFHISNSYATSGSDVARVGGTLDSFLRAYNPTNTVSRPDEFSSNSVKTSLLGSDLSDELPHDYAGIKLNYTPSGTVTTTVGGITFNADQFRTLFINQSEMEKMARTDGSYTQFGLAFFGVASKASRTYKPTYIGGTYQPIVYTEVVQTSATTGSASSSGSPLGASAGHGVSSFGDVLGTQYCDDYGYILVMASIMPDTYYSQGLDRMWTRRTQADMYLPERDKLGMEPILNKELYFSGDVETDDDVWAYQNRHDEYRYTSNRISGKVADSTNRSFFPYTQARHFSSLPGYSADFARADDVRKDYLFADVEDAFVCQFAVSARAVRCMPYKAVPASII